MIINRIVKKYNTNVPLLMTIVVLSWGTFAALSKLSLSRIDEYQAQFFMFLWAAIGLNIMFLFKILTCTVVLIAIVLRHKTPDNVAFWDFEKPNPTASPLFQGDFLVGS